MALSKRIEEWRALCPHGVTARSVAQVAEILRLAVTDIATLAMERDAARAALARLSADIEGELVELEAQASSSAGGGHNLPLSAGMLGEFLDRVHAMLAASPR